jgi:acyl carrier protein
VPDTERRISDYVVRNYLFGDDSRLPERSESLVELGVVDSTGILEMIEFIESEFGIQVTDNEAVPENLGSIANVASFVDRKRAGG